MKVRVAFMLIFASFLISGASFACGGGGCSSGCGQSSGGGCGTQVSCNNCDSGDWNNQYAYESQRGCDCDCADKGWRYNDCISKCEYCEAFGNIGGRRY